MEALVIVHLDELYVDPKEAVKDTSRKRRYVFDDIVGVVPTFLRMQIPIYLLEYEDESETRGIYRPMRKYLSSVKMISMGSHGTWQNLDTKEQLMQLQIDTAYLCGAQRGHCVQNLADVLKRIDEDRVEYLDEGEVQRTMGHWFAERRSTLMNTHIEPVVLDYLTID